MMKKITLMFSLFFVCFWWQTHSQTSPVNDDLANAIPLIMGASCTNDFFTNTDATAQTDEPEASCFTGATHTVWFTFTAPASGAVEISTDIFPGDLEDSQIAVYPAPSDPNDLSTLPAEVGCDQDSGTMVSNGTSTYMSVLEVGGLTPNDIYYVQVDGWNGETGDFCVQVQEVTCPDPSNLTVSNLTDTSAEISWVESGTAAMWDIEYGPTGFLPSGTPTVEDVTNPFYTIPGLTRNTAYEAYIRSDCGGGDVSNWVGPIGFTTVCAGLPYVESFSSGTFPDCWTRSSTSDVVIEATCGSRSNVLRFDNSEQAITVSLDASGASNGLQVSYYIADSVCGSAADTGETFNVDYWDGAQWITAKTYDASRPNDYTYESFIVPQSDVSNNFQVRFDQIAGTTDSWFIDELIVQEPPTCFIPTSLTATSITANGADLDWNENTTPPATTWDVHIVPSGDPSPTSFTTPTDPGVTTKPYPVSTLNPSTSYDFYVRSDCGGGDTSLWAGPFTFTTTCLTAPLPYTEDFSSGTFPICWSRTDATDVSVVATCDSRSNVLNISDTNDVTTVPIDGTTSTTGLKVSYFVGDDLCGGATEDPLDVSYWDGTQWVVAKTYETDASGMPYANAYFYDSFIVPQSDVTANFQLRFSSNETINGDDWYIDQLVVQETPTCLVPTSLTATNVMATTADLDWTENNAATTWDVHIVPAGDPTPTGTTTPSNPGVTKPYTATLTPSTSYDFYVRSDCGGGDLSIWAGPFTFATTCLAATIPYTEDFSSGTFPICWTRTSTTDVTVEATCDTRSNVLNISDANDVTTVPIDGTTATTGLEVSYYIGEDLCGGATEDPFDVSYWDGAQWVVAKTYEVLGGEPYDNAYFHDSFLVPQSEVTAGFKVRFSSNETLNSDNWYIDQLVVQAAPTCLAPSGLTATATTTTADLGWTDNNVPPSSLWDVHVVPAGDPAPTGTTTPSNSGVTSNPYTITGLSQCVSYEFYVRADCGGGDLSAWAGPFAFSLTGVGVVTAPYTEAFENEGIIPNCWSQGASNSEDWIFDTTGGHVGNAGDFLGTTSASGGGLAYVDDSTPDNMGTTLVTPQVDVSGLTTPILSFYTISDNEGNTNVSFSVDFYDGTNWNTGVYTSSSNTGGWIKIFVDLSAYTITGPVQARFIVDENNPSGDFYDDRAIDDVSFIEAPTCIQPSGLTATGIMGTTAILGWTDNNAPTAGSWDIEIVPSGTPPTGTPTATGVSNPYNATNLSPVTSYDFYVRANCGGGDMSTWAGPYMFTTACGTIVAPFSEGFAGSSTPNCWTESGDEPWDYSLSAGYDATSVPDHTPGGGTNYAWIDDSVPFDVGDSSTLTSPLVDVSALTNPVLEFFLFSSNSDSSTFNIVDVEFYDGAVWNPILTVNSSLGPNFVQFIFDLNTFNITGDVRVRFTITGGPGTTFHNDILLDDVAFKENPCPAPTALSVNGTTDTTADVSWTPGGSETEWEIEYGPTGFAIGTGTVIIDNDGTPDETITGLAPETDYEVYVRAVCTEVTSTVGPATFTTAVLVCPDVTNVSVVDVTETSFEVTWTAGGAETVWKIEYGPVGFTPGTGIVVIDDDGIGEVIIGLEIDTEYDVYVTAICDGFDGTNVGPETFDTTFGIEDQLFEDFSYYPNPVSGQLYLKASNQVQKVVIYNLLGQKIMKITPDSLSPTLDLSNLQTGTYLMQVTIKGSNGVYKILKE